MLTFHNFDSIVTSKDDKIQKLKSKLESARSERFSFSAESEQLKDQLQVATSKIDKLALELTK
jgi:hypothetical protein